MRINGMGPGIAGAPDTGSNSMVDQIMEVERIPLKQAEARKGRVVQEKNEYSSLGTMLGELGTAADGIKMPSGFRAMQFESSHPEILDGMVDGAAEIGSYEFEVKGLAQADKYLDVGFPDKDKTHVGFGYMSIGREDGKDMDIQIDPGSTLQDVVAKVNSSGAGVKAQIVNTGISEDPFRLMITSEKTGEAAKVNIDADTTYLNFDNIKGARNLDLKFEDVDVSRGENKVGDLIDGVKLNAKRGEPGTKVTVNVSHDVDKTTANIKGFTEKYNQIVQYSNKQFTYDPSQKKVEGNLSGDGNMRTMMRTLQSQLNNPSALAGTKYNSLAEIGIKTNAKTGELDIDETKLKAALASDYEEVSKLFTVSESGQGVASRVADTVKNFQGGVMANRQKSLDTMIHNQDQSIEKQSRRLEERQVQLESQFNNMQNRVATLNNQGAFLSARLGGSQQGGSGGGSGGQQ